MLRSVDTNAELKDLKLQIMKPDKTVIGNLKEAYNKTYNPKLGDLNEITFYVPYEVDRDHQLVSNPNIDKLKDRYLIKATYNNETEWFRISKRMKGSGNNGDHLSITAHSLGIELSDKNVRNVDEVSKNANEIMTIALEETLWSIGTVDDEFLAMYRSFEISETTRLDFMFRIAKTFKGVLVWDTINRTVSLRTQDVIGSNKGLVFSYGKYIKTLSEESDSQEMVTRLIPQGYDGLTIRSVSPTGTEYIDDFTYFLYPFQREADGTVTQQSDYMSDGLCHAILDYNDLLDSKDGEYSTLLTERESLNSTLTTKENELASLQTDLALKQDEIDIALSNGQDTTTLKAERDTIQSDITTKESEIAQVKTDLNTNQTNINDLQTTLSMGNNFTLDQIVELNSYIIEKHWSNENIINAEDLLAEAKKEFEDIKTPKTVFSLDIVSFIQSIESQQDWDKLNLGDTIAINHERLGINITAKIIEFSIDFENQSIQLTIANTKDIKTDQEKFIERLYNFTSSTSIVNAKKLTWDKAVQETSDISQIIDEKWDATKREVIAGVKESVSISRRGIKITDSADPNTYLVAQNSVLAITGDNGETWKHAITKNGIVGEQIFGKLIAGQNLVIDATDTNGVNTFTVDASGVTINGTSLNINGGLSQTNLETTLSSKINSALQAGTSYNSVKIDSTNGFVAQRDDVLTKTIVNATDGLFVQKNTGTATSPIWTNTFYVDTNGSLMAEELITNKLMVKNGTDVLIDADTKKIDFSKFATKVGQLSADNLNLKGMNVVDDLGNTTLSISSTGDVSLSGNVTMTTGSTLSADYINGGTISGVKVNVSTDATVGDNLYLGDQTLTGKGVHWFTDTYINRTVSYLNIVCGDYISIDSSLKTIINSDTDVKGTLDATYMYENGYRVATQSWVSGASVKYATDAGNSSKLGGYSASSYALENNTATFRSVYSYVSGYGYFRMDNNNYIRIGTNGIYLIVGGTVKTSFSSIPKVRLDPDGDGVINDKSFGANNPASMQPVLTDYIKLDLNGESLIELDKNFLNFVSDYYLFLSDGDAIITDKGEGFFKIKGTGKVMVQVVGLQKGKEDVVGYDIVDDVNGESEFKGRSTAKRNNVM